MKSWSERKQSDTERGGGGETMKIHRAWLSHRTHESLSLNSLVLRASSFAGPAAT